MEDEPTKLSVSSDSFARTIAAAAPDFCAAADGLIEAIRDFVHFAYRRSSNEDATAVARRDVSNQMLNDYLVAITSIASGDGRSAVRSSRSVFEHLVNYLTVGDEVQAERYNLHYSVAEADFIEWLEGYMPELLTSKELRSYRHRSKVYQRDRRPAADLAIERFGTRFRSGWATESLFARAERFGLEHDYLFYRASSALLHGGAIGRLGTRTVLENDDNPIHRTGPALSLCPISLIASNRFFARFLDESSVRIGRDAVASLQQAVAAIRECERSFNDAILAVDSDLWPDAAIDRQAIIVLRPDGGWSWHVVDLLNRLIVAATPPTLSQEDSARLKSAIDRKHRVQAGRSVNLGVFVPFDVEPKPGARWIEERLVIGPKPLSLKHDRSVAPIDPDRFDPTLFDDGALEARFRSH